MHTLAKEALEKYCLTGASLFTGSPHCKLGQIVWQRRVLGLDVHQGSQRRCRSNSDSPCRLEFRPGAKPRCSASSACPPICVSRWSGALALSMSCGPALRRRGPGALRSRRASREARDLAEVQALPIAPSDRRCGGRYPVFVPSVCPVSSLG